MNNNLIKLCRLFANKSAAGKNYWSGRLGDARLVALPVINTSGEPADFDIFIAPQRTAPDKPAPAAKPTPGYQMPLSSRPPSRRAQRVADALQRPLGNDRLGRGA